MRTDRRVVADLSSSLGVFVLPVMLGVRERGGGGGLLRGTDSQVKCLSLWARPGSAPRNHTLLVLQWGPPQGLQVAIDGLRVQVDTPVVHVAVIVSGRAASVCRP